MNDERLQALLRQAEPTGAPCLEAAHDLAERVRSQLRWRQQRTRAAAMALPAILLAVGAYVWTTTTSSNLPPEELRRAELSASPERNTSHAVDSTSKQGIEARVARLKREADLQQLVARRLMQLERYDLAAEFVEQDRDQLDELENSRRQLDVVAFRMILRADRLRETMSPSVEAIAIYEDVVRLYPTTDSAEIARARLADILSGRGGNLP